MPTTFTLAAPSAPRPLPARPKSPLAVLGKFRKDYTSPGVCEVVKAVTDDGEWLFERAADGTWLVGHLPTETVVKTGLRGLRACRLYAGPGKAAADLERIQAGERKRANMDETSDERIRCAWCETELAAIDAAPIKYARLPGASDAENMQCADAQACRERQDRLDDAQRRELIAQGLGWLVGLTPAEADRAAAAAKQENADD